MLSIPKSPVAASIFSGLAGIASIYAGPQGFMLELAREKEIASVTADGDENYRAALPIGAYVLDVQDRAQKHVRSEAATVHDCLKSDRARRYDDRHRIQRRGDRPAGIGDLPAINRQIRIKLSTSI